MWWDHINTAHSDIHWWTRLFFCINSVTPSKPRNSNTEQFRRLDGNLNTIAWRFRRFVISEKECWFSNSAQKNPLHFITTPPDNPFTATADLIPAAAMLAQWSPALLKQARWPENTSHQIWKWEKCISL